MNRALGLLLLLAALVGGIYLIADSGPAVPTSERQDPGTDPSSGTGSEQKAGASAAEPESRQQVGAPAAGAAAAAGGPGAKAPSVLLRGRLVTGSGQPRAGALLLQVHPHDLDQIRELNLESAQMDPPIPAEAGADGRFSIRMPAGRTADLRVADEGLILRERDGTLEFEVGAEDKDLGDLVVLRTASIVGRVVAGGRGIPGVKVVQVRRTGLLSLLSDPGVSTDEQGRFELERLVPGAIKIATRSPEYLPAELSLDVAEGQRREGVLIQLRQGGVIEGMVVDDRGLALAGAVVSASRRRQLDAGIEMRGFTEGESTRTDSSGNFRLAGLAEPTVELRASKDGHGVATARGVKAGTTNTVLELSRHGEVHGQLVDEAGEPIAGSQISALPTEPARRSLMGLAGGRVETDAEGRFVLKGVTAGANEVVAKGAAHLDARAVVEVRPGEAAKDVRLVGGWGATLAVTVRDAKGQPVADAAVSVSTVPENPLAGLPPTGGRARMRSVRRVARRASGPGAGEAGRTVTRILGGAELLGTATTDARGMAVFRGMAAGQVEVVATHRELAATSAVKVSVPDGGEATAQLSMLRGGSVDITVVDHDGKPLNGAPILIKGPLDGGDAPVTDKHRADAEGRQRIGPLRPGSYEAVLGRQASRTNLGGGLSITLPGETPEMKDTAVSFVVAADATASLRLVKPRLTTVSGIVRDAKGPVAGAEVDVLGEGDFRLPMLAQSRARTDEQGRFSIPEVSSGTYRLTFQRPGAAVPGEKEITLVKNQPVSEHDLRLGGGVVKLKVEDDAEGFGVGEAMVTLQRYQPPRAGGASSAPAQPRRVMMVSISTSSTGGGADAAPTSLSMTVGAGGVQTDAKGHAEIDNLPSGKFTLRVEHKDYATLTKVITLGDDEVKDLGVLRIHEGCTVRGRVQLPKTAQLSMATVQIRGDGDFERTTVQHQGSFSFTGLKAGTYRVRAQAIGSEDWGPEKTVVTAPGEAGRVSLELPKK